MNELRDYRGLFPPAGERIDKSGLDAEQAARQKAMLAACAGFLDSVIDRRQCPQAERIAFMRKLTPLLMANAAAAARAALDMLDHQVRAWKAELTPQEWNELTVIVVGRQLPRKDNMAVQYFARLLGQSGEGKRLIYAEGLGDEPRSLDLLATHRVDTQIGIDFFNDPNRMARDLLSDATRDYLPLLDQADERTSFQTGAAWNPMLQLPADVAMCYGVGSDPGPRIKQWKAKGYIVHVMTGVAWGNYQDYLYGRFDGKRHVDEAQKDRHGNVISHGGDVYYMCPGPTFGDYLAQRVRVAIEAGASSIHLEEPEFWSRAGYSEGFKRAWQNAYGEAWTPPDGSPDAQYRASRLKYVLYRDALKQVFDAVRADNARTGRKTRCYVATHSLVNYAHWNIVSPESSLLSVGGDGFIAQTWTGTARPPTTTRASFVNGPSKPRSWSMARWSRPRGAAAAGSGSCTIRSRTTRTTHGRTTGATGNARSSPRCSGQRRPATSWLPGPNVSSTADIRPSIKPAANAVSRSIASRFPRRTRPNCSRS